MNRIVFFVPVVALFGVLSGCCKRRVDPPVPTADNVTVEFALTNGGDFAAAVAGVDVGVFDASGVHLRDEWLTGEADVMTLDEGSYRLVFWGNVDGRVKFDMDAAVPTVTYSDLADFQSSGLGEAVFYGPFDRDRQAVEYLRLEVPASGRVSERVMMMPAFCSIDIYLQGLPDEALPTVHIAGLANSLSYFGMRPVGDGVTVSRAAQGVERDGKRYHVASFASPLFDGRAMDDLALVVDHPGGEYKIAVADALAASGSNDYNPEDLDIDLLLDFIGAQVNITIPKWSSSEIGVKTTRELWAGTSK